MQNDLIKISAVSYSNTFPFIYGLEHSEIISQIEIQRDIPSVCAQKLAENTVDIGLVPIAVLPEIKNYNIISNFCIGAKEYVDSVFLFSQTSVNKLDNIILDYQSRTSNGLTRILAGEYWNFKGEIIPAYQNYENDIKHKTGGIVIGDRAISLKNKFKYKVDLANEWYKFTGNRFVFALWVSNKKLPSEFVKEFNSALKFGIESLSSDLISEYYKNENSKELYNYLTKNIDYNFDKSKQDSLKMYLEKLRKLS